MSGVELPADGIAGNPSRAAIKALITQRSQISGRARPHVFSSKDRTKTNSQRDDTAEKKRRQAAKAARKAGQK